MILTETWMRTLTIAYMHRQAMEGKMGSHFWGYIRIEKFNNYE